MLNDLSPDKISVTENLTFDIKPEFHGINIKVNTFKKKKITQKGFFYVNGVVQDQIQKRYFAQ